MDRVGILTGKLQLCFYLYPAVETKMPPKKGLRLTIFKPNFESSLKLFIVNPFSGVLSFNSTLSKNTIVMKYWILGDC